MPTSPVPKRSWSVSFQILSLILLLWQLFFFLRKNDTNEVNWIQREKKAYLIQWFGENRNSKWDGSNLNKTLTRYHKTSVIFHLFEGKLWFCKAPESIKTRKLIEHKTIHWFQSLSWKNLITSNALTWFKFFNSKA